MSRPTDSEVEAAKTENGGWTRAQLAEWGVPWPPPEGWRDRLREEALLNSASDDENAPKWQSLGRTAQQAIRVADFAKELQPYCDSPIEVMLGANLRCLVSRRRINAEVLPQFKIQRFRYDFAMLVPGMGYPPVVLIECDGAEFHSTPAQLENDRKKDALAAERRSTILRFTGKDIVRDAYGCALVALNEFMQRTGGR